jgi:RND family efflux transporter MFP subunit
MRAHAAILAMAAACVVALAANAARAAEFTVTPTSIEELKAVFGEVRSRHVVPARTRIGGTITEITVTEGTKVTKGEVIAKIVDPKIALQIDAADSDIKAAASQLDAAQVALDRAQSLFKTGATTKAVLDQAQTQVDVLANQLASAKSKRDVLSQQASEGDTVAPEDGRVIAVPVTLGSVVLAGDSIATVAGGGYFLRLYLPERHATEITEGGTVLVGQRVLSAEAAGADGPDPAKARKGTLVKIYPEITDGRVLADVEVDGLGTYFVGERTLVWVPVAHRQVLAVPPAAVTTRHGVDYIRLTGAGEEPVDVAVILGETFEHDGTELTEILTGLQAGDKVLVP